MHTMLPPKFSVTIGNLTMPAKTGYGSDNFYYDENGQGDWVEIGENSKDPERNKENGLTLLAKAKEEGVAIKSEMEIVKNKQNYGDQQGHYILANMLKLACETPIILFITTSGQQYQVYHTNEMEPEDLIKYWESLHLTLDNLEKLDDNLFEIYFDSEELLSDSNKFKTSVVYINDKPAVWYSLISREEFEKQRNYYSIGVYKKLDAKCLYNLSKGKALQANNIKSKKLPPLKGFDVENIS